MYKKLLPILAFAALCGCNSETATQYLTTGDKSCLFQQSEIPVSKRSAQVAADFEINPEETFQTIDGFGAAVTWATCYNLLKMTPEDRSALLNELFNPETGLGISLARVTIGASDFNYEEYTWCDTPGLENFAVDPRDREVLFPILHEIYKINPDLKLIASPWSTPKWMKMTVDGKKPFDSWTSGRLDPKYYQDYADYLLKWVKTMENEGFDIYAITLQNEPLNHGNSMSTFMPWQDQLAFIKASVGETFAKNAPDTKILLFDHNYNYDRLEDQQQYPLHIYDDKEAAKYIDGSAWHNYGGRVSELQKIHDYAPEKSIYFTEASIGSWNYSFDRSMILDFQSIFMDTMKYGNKGVTLWNFVLDDQNGPFSPQQGSCRTCYGVVTVSHHDYKILDRTSHYYDIAHAAKVVKAGAVRIGCNAASKVEGVDCLAFLNPDGSYAALIVNANPETASDIIIATPEKSISVSCAPASIVSLIWN